MTTTPSPSPAHAADAAAPGAGPAASSRPVADGLFEGLGDHAHLLGSRCLGCGCLYFPRSLGCRNPACNDRRVEDARLPRTGTLYSYTVQAYRPPALFKMDAWAPYALALVDLGTAAGSEPASDAASSQATGLRVLGMLTACRVEDLRIGMPVELTTGALYRDEAGQDVHTYKFRPVMAEGAAA